MKLKPGYIFQKNKTGGTIFDPESSRLITFNATAFYLVSLLKKHTTKKVLTLVYAERYHLLYAEALRDVEGVMTKLISLRMVESATPAPTSQIKVATGRRKKI